MARIGLILERYTEKLEGDLVFYMPDVPNAFWGISMNGSHVAVSLFISSLYAHYIFGAGQNSPRIPGCPL